MRIYLILNLFQDLNLQFALILRINDEKQLVKKNCSNLFQIKEKQKVWHKQGLTRFASAFHRQIRVAIPSVERPFDRTATGSRCLRREEDVRKDGDGNAAQDLHFQCRRHA